MICQMCGAEEATIHLTEIVNNQMIELHICEHCAKEKSVEITPQLGFPELLAGLVDFTSQQRDEQQLACPACGLTYEQFKKGGRLGCAQCYVSFQAMLLALIKRVQGGVQHVGKRPSHLDTKPTIDGELRALNEQLRKHIELEEFEEAAQVRDKIKMLEKKQDTAKNAKEHTAKTKKEPREPKRTTKKKP